MAIFRGTSRHEYTKQKVKEMRIARKSLKSKKEGVSDKQYQDYFLGDLLAAGHLKLNGKLSYQQEVETLPTINMHKKTHNITLEVHQADGYGDKAHMVGYLMSGSDRDQRFRIKGWINTDGTIRLELVK